MRDDAVGGRGEARIVGEAAGVAVELADVDDVGPDRAAAYRHLRRLVFERQLGNDLIGLCRFFMDVHSADPFDTRSGHGLRSLEAFRRAVQARSPNKRFVVGLASSRRLPARIVPMRPCTLILQRNIEPQSRRAHGDGFNSRRPNAPRTFSPSPSWRSHAFAWTRCEGRRRGGVHDSRSAAPPPRPTLPAGGDDVGALSLVTASRLGRECGQGPPRGPAQP